MPHHRFSDPKLLELALTHSSVEAVARDNERLEFLGDAVLDLAVAEILYARHPELSEGEMTERKAALVSRKCLAAVAAELRLESDLRVGPGFGKDSLPRSILANLYEAVLGAVYLDGGLDSAREFVELSLGARLQEKQDESHVPHPKQGLQEHCQRQYGCPPRYVLVTTRGRAHARAFEVRAEVEGFEFPSAWGRTRKEAESWAAAEALLVLREEEAEAAEESDRED